MKKGKKERRRSMMDIKDKQSIAIHQANAATEGRKQSTVVEIATVFARNEEKKKAHPDLALDEAWGTARTTTTARVTAPPPFVTCGRGTGACGYQ